MSEKSFQESQEMDTAEFDLFDLSQTPPNHHSQKLSEYAYRAKLKMKPTTIEKKVKHKSRFFDTNRAPNPRKLEFKDKTSKERSRANKMSKRSRQNKKR